MNILKKMAEMNAIMWQARERINELPEEKQKHISDGVYYTKTLDSKVKCWESVGSKTFILSKSLIEAFMNTDISLDMAPRDFHYPFESFMIEGEAPFFSTTTFGGGNRIVDSILYMDSKLITRQDGVIAVDLDGNLKSIDWRHSFDAFFPSGSGFGMERLMMYMRDDEPVKTSVFTRKPGSMMMALSEEDAQNMMNIFFNTVLYINDPTRNVEETEEHGSRKLKILNGETRRSKYIYLKPPKSYKPLYASTGRTLDKRFIVRGHWRNQAFGEKFASRRLMWLKPFWKGPEMSEIVSKPYLVR